MVSQTLSFADSRETFLDSVLDDFKTLSAPLKSDPFRKDCPESSLVGHNGFHCGLFKYRSLSFVTLCNQKDPIISANKIDLNYVWLQSLQSVIQFITVRGQLLFTCYYSGWTSEFCTNKKTVFYVLSHSLCLT